MAKRILHIPRDLHVDLTMQDTLCIQVIQDCNWCYSDKDGVFSPPPKGILKPGFYAAQKPPKTYGPYKPNHTGMVLFNASDPPSPCVPDSSKKRVPHTITVSNR